MPSETTVSRRDRILAAAEAEFAANGYTGARVERIAETAAVNKQLLFHYFDSKAGLHKAVADAVASRSVIGPPPGKTPVERLRKLVDQLVRATWQYETLLSGEWRSSAAAMAKSVVEDGQRTGHFRDDVDASGVSEVIIAASFGRRTSDVESQRADVDHSRFVGSLVQMVVDHCSWR